MDRSTAYKSFIPPEAEERVVNRYPDGVKERAEYWLNGELVGVRQFDEAGGLVWEGSYRAGVMHGMTYRWDQPGQLTSAEPWENGVPHGTACQWGEDGKVIGTYTLDHGTGIDLWRQDWPDGSVELAEAHYLVKGRPHGFEWWLNGDQRSVWIERHWADGDRHGVERQWNAHRRLSRGYPRYWIRGERVTKRQYLKAALQDLTLPPFRPEENAPQRIFPPEIVEHLA